MKKEYIIRAIQDRIEKLEKEEENTLDPRIAYALDLAVKELSAILNFAKFDGNEWAKEAKKPKILSGRPLTPEEIKENLGYFKGVKVIKY